MDIELNDEWIKNFEDTDKLYQEFYNDDLWYINLKFLYINRDNELDLIKTETFLMTKPNYISREEILQILKRYSVVNDRGYSLLSILKYNITLEPENIKQFLYSNECDFKFLNIVKNIDATTFERTINTFQDLNDLIFVFYEKSNQLKILNPNTMTKKINIDQYKSKKTIRKRYKD